MILLPEMFATGFTINSSEFAEEKNGATEGFIQKLAMEKSAFRDTRKLSNK